MSRAHISLKTKLAAAVRELLRIPHEHAVLMTEDQILSLVEWHHIAYHAHEGGDEHHNIDPMTIMAHRERTRKIDIPAIAKTKRISADHEAFRARLLTPRADRAPKKSRWGNRPFPKQRRK